MFNVQFSLRKPAMLAVFSFFAAIVSGQTIRKVKVTDLEKIISESKTPLIINFWATWCVPCVEEIPYFQEEVKKHEKDSLQLLLVSLDMRDAYPDGLTRFVQKRKIKVPVNWLDETNADYFCPKIDPRWSGALPASLFINNKTGYRKFFEEQLTRDTLQKEIMAILQ